ncbi:hypothetical protein [Haladaptatus sp.]|uniref:hypothetical protein n=1 Tax=Haladaptatus sp. TaxID=1973141 RepID=UPI003C60BC3E
MVVQPLQPIPLHAVPSSPPTPVPHWAVLMVAVPLLWVVIAGGVLLVDTMFERLSRIE